MAEEERKAVSGFFLQYFWVAAGEWNMLHLCIRIYSKQLRCRGFGGRKKTPEKQLTTKQICNSMYTEANGRSYSKENIQYGK